MANGPMFPVVMREPMAYQIPWEWQHIVCMCSEDGGTKHDDETYGIFMVCGRCGKYKRFYGSRCAKCKEYYLIVFSCKAWAPRENCCWKCLEPHDDRCTPPMPIVQPRIPATAEEIEVEVNALGSIEFDFEF